MELYTVALSLIIGFSIGIIYGLFFLLNGKKRVLIPTQDSHNPRSHKRHYLSFLLSSCMRITTLIILWYFLLRSPTIHFILVLVSFITAFWLVILKDRAKTHDRNTRSDQ